MSFSIDPGEGYKKKLPALLLGWQQGIGQVLSTLLQVRVNMLWETRKAVSPPWEYAGVPSTEVFQNTSVGIYLPCLCDSLEGIWVSFGIKVVKILFHMLGWEHFQTWELNFLNNENPACGELGV